MFIDTHSYDTMYQSVCECFGITPSTLTQFLNATAQKCFKDKYCNGDILDTEVETFIQKNSPKQYIEQILFFHLGRRLNNADTEPGNNLLDLLTSKTSISDFFAEHQVNFTNQNGYIEIYENGNKVPLEDTYRTSVCYLRSRLGYNVGREDFCFNGFAFKDLLYKNDYARSLYHGPEFVTRLSAFLKRPDITQDYFLNSTYYCYEYLVPLDVILFDDNDKLNLNEKVSYFLSRLLHRLFEYATSDSQYMFDHDNPILRLNDSVNMPSEFYRNRELITSEMLR